MLPTSKRVTTELFGTIVEKGASVFTPTLSLRFISETTHNPSRFSVTVSKKVFKRAVDRNNLKRRVNAALIKVYPQVKNGFAGVIFGKNSTNMRSHKELVVDIEELLKRAKMIV